MSSHEERELRLVHRIESFSDLVIGFSLALLGLTLVIPEHAVPSSPTSFFALHLSLGVYFVQVFLHFHTDADRAIDGNRILGSAHAAA